MPIEVAADARAVGRVGAVATGEGAPEARLPVGPGATTEAQATVSLPATASAAPLFAGAPVRVPAVEPVHRVAGQDVAEAQGGVVPVRHAADEQVALRQTVEEEAVATGGTATVVLGTAGVAAVLEGVAAGYEVAGVGGQRPTTPETGFPSPVLLVLGARAAAVALVATRTRAATRVVDVNGVATEVVAVLGPSVAVAAMYLQVVPKGDREARVPFRATSPRRPEVRQDARSVIEGVGAEGTGVVTTVHLRPMPPVLVVEMEATRAVGHPITDQA